MKKFILAVLTILFTVLPSFSSDNGTLFKIFVVVWPVSAFLLVVLYIKWFNEIYGIGKNNKITITRIRKNLVKKEEQKAYNEETDEIKD